MEKIISYVLITIGGICALFIAYGLFVLSPVRMYAQAECLRSGFPVAHVTIGLERYCSTLDGAVTVKVEKK